MMSDKAVSNVSAVIASLLYLAAIILWAAGT